MYFRENNNGGKKRAYPVTNILRMRGLAFAIILPYLQKCSYLHCRSAFDHQTWQGGDLP